VVQHGPFLTTSRKWAEWYVAETYSAAWSLRLDPGNPIQALALKSLKSYPLVSCVSIDTRKEMVLKACKDYSIDGAILHRNKSCVPITLGQMDIMRALDKELGIPSVIIDADHMDPDNFSAAQFENRVDAFMEMLLEKKRARVLSYTSTGGQGIDFPRYFRTELPEDLSHGSHVDSPVF